ncbi:LacI family DNA-binding transcriptional regulator [Nesterenkonia populi]|uniref:LacI family DNA-binding transcriptional regulator n=1 Tax=Nesterenkonia populi TaxID=1591087 RepID=UPI0011BE0A2D|nr:LacI family DNA-binding transcriptional regulator [Nesterenkonia populi]
MPSDDHTGTGFYDRPVTLRDVADAAGVHISTVSRALRRASSGGGSSRTREFDQRIAALAEDLGYTRNPNAASLTTNRSSALGVVVPHLTDIVLSAAYDAIESTANQAGYDAFVANSHDDPEAQKRRINLLIGRRVDGLILGDAHLDGTNLEYLERRRVPFVLVNRRSPGYLSVVSDDYGGGYQAGKHLAALGHTQIGIVGAAQWASTAYDRAKGCVDALAEAGIDIPEHCIVNTGFDAREGHQGAEQLLALEDRPTAIFTVNDFSAIGAMGAVTAAGLRPGHDIGVVGYNDISIASELPVPLTTVSSPFQGMGGRAVEILLAVLHNLPASPVTLPTKLVVRDSTVPLT